MRPETKKSPRPDDLTALIQQANSEVREYHGTTPKAGSSRGSRHRLTLAGLLLTGALSVAWAFPWLKGVPDTSVRSALVRAAEEARKEVEAWRRTKGELPAALPSASLSRLVTYSPSGAGYRLGAASGAVRIEMDETGTVIDR